MGDNALADVLYHYIKDIKWPVFRVQNGRKIDIYTMNKLGQAVIIVAQTTPPTEAQRKYQLDVMRSKGHYIIAGSLADLMEQLYDYI